MTPGLLLGNTELLCQTLLLKAVSARPCYMSSIHCKQPPNDSWPCEMLGPVTYVFSLSWRCAGLVSQSFKYVLRLRMHLEVSVGLEWRRIRCPQGKKTFASRKAFCANDNHVCNSWSRGADVSLSKLDNKLQLLFKTQAFIQDNAAKICIYNLISLEKILSRAASCDLRPVHLKLNNSLNFKTDHRWIHTFNIDAPLIWNLFFWRSLEI